MCCSYSPDPPSPRKTQKLNRVLPLQYLSHSTSSTPFSSSLFPLLIIYHIHISSKYFSFYSVSVSLWIISYHIISLWIIIYHYVSLRIIMYHYESLWIVMNHIISLWIISYLSIISTLSILSWSYLFYLVYDISSLLSTVTIAYYYLLT